MRKMFDGSGLTAGARTMYQNGGENNRGDCAGCGRRKCVGDGGDGGWYGIHVV